MHFPRQAIRVTAYTTETDKIRMAEIMRRDVSAYVESGGRRKPLTENSTLLRNVRKVFSRRSSARSSVIQAARLVLIEISTFQHNNAVECFWRSPLITI